VTTLRLTESEIGPMTALRWAGVRRPKPPVQVEMAPMVGELNAAVAAHFCPGLRVGIAVGSRGIADIAEVTANIVKEMPGSVESSSSALRGGLSK
jgi:hypothetical protein